MSEKTCTVMSDEQYKRYRKMNAEDINCLYFTRNKSKDIYFLVFGSSGVNYKVVIFNNGKITCSCPDFKHGCKTHSCVCKHCLFIIYKKMKLFKDINHVFFDRLFFTPDELQSIRKWYRSTSKLNK